MGIEALTHTRRAGTGNGFVAWSRLPSTLGTSRMTSELDQPEVAGPGLGRWGGRRRTIDLDSTICETYGLKEGGAPTPARLLPTGPLALTC